MRQLVIAPSGEITTFSIDALQRAALLEGLDEIGLTLKCADEINELQNADRMNRPWVWQTAKVRL
jgi:3-isopropylmalate/(R)-2-methylmalate dehydratase small subunit